MRYFSRNTSPPQTVSWLQDNLLQLHSSFSRLVVLCLGVAVAISFALALLPLFFQVGYVFGKGGNTIADVKSKAGVNIITDVSWLSPNPFRTPIIAILFCLQVFFTVAYVRHRAAAFLPDVCTMVP